MDLKMSVYCFLGCRKTLLISLSSKGHCLCCGRPEPGTRPPPRWRSRRPGRSLAASPGSGRTPRGSVRMHPSALASTPQPAFSRGLLFPPVIKLKIEILRKRTTGSQNPRCALVQRVWGTERVCGAGWRAWAARSCAGRDIPLPVRWMVRSGELGPSSTGKP